MARISINTYHNTINFELTFTSVSQNIANNTSQVRVLGRLIGTGNGEWDSTTTTGTVTFNGTNYPFNVTPYSFSDGSSVNRVLFDQTITVAHGSDGRKTVSGSMSWSHGSWAFKTAYVTESVTLAIIPRYTTVTNPSISSITRNSYKFSFSTGNTIDEWQYSSNGGAWQANEEQKGDRTSATKTLSGFGANTKPTIRVRVKRKDSQLWTASSTVTVTLEATASPNTPTFSSITRNSFRINVGANKSFNGFRYSLDDGASWSAKVSSSSVNITGRPANRLYNVRVQVYDGVHTGTLSGTSARGQVRTLAIASPNTPTLASRTAIQAVVNWSSNRTVTNVRYKRWSSDTWHSTGSGFSERTSGSFTILGLSPNTVYSISVQVQDAVHGTWSGGSGALSVATYALSTIIGSNTTVDTDAKSFVLSKAVSSMSQNVTLQMRADSQQWINIKSWTNTNGGGFTLTASEVALIQNNRVGTNTLTVRYECTTRWGAGGTVQGTTYSSHYTWTLVGVNPTLDGATYKDVHSNTDFVAWKGGDQKILRNSSLLQVTLGKANAIKGAKLVKYVLNIAGKQYTTNATSGATEQTGAIINADIVNAGTNQTATIEVFDTRGNKVTRTLTVQMVDYYPPQLIHGTGERLNSYEQPTYLNFLARYSQIIVGGVDVNELTAQYRIKVKGNADSTYGAFVDIVAPKGSVNGIWQEVGSSQFMQNLDENTIYTMHIRYRDPVVAFVDYYVDINMGIGLMEFFEDKVELGVPLYDKNSAKKYLLEGEGGLDTVSWSEVTSKPTTATRWPTWGEVTGKPNLFSRNVSNIQTFRSGWHRVAWVSGDGRGTIRIGIYTTGGSWTPSYTEIFGFHDWSTVASIPFAFRSGSGYVTSARFTAEGGRTYFECYFTRDFNGNLVVYDAGYNTYSVYTGVLPSGGGQVHVTADIPTTIIYSGGVG